MNAKTPDPRAAVKRCEKPVLTKAGNRFDCGRCDYCIWKGERTWLKRAEAERISMPPNRCVVMGCLTIAPEHLHQLLPDWGKNAYYRFRKNLEQIITRQLGYAPGLKLLAVPEFGDKNNRLHLHFLAMRVPDHMTAGPLRHAHNGRYWYDTPFNQCVEQAWSKGFVRTDLVRSIGGVAYVLKYVTKGRADAKIAKAKDHELRAKLKKLGLDMKPRQHLWWWSTPRGKHGGLARQFAEAAADTYANHPAYTAAMKQRHDVPNGYAQPRNKPASPTPDLDPRHQAPRRPTPRLVKWTRYEREILRNRCGMNQPSEKLWRAATNPENAEMKWRVHNAGGVEQLRMTGDWRDPDVAAAAKQQVATRRQLGRH